MCGIAGIISNDTSLVNKQSIKKMTDIIAHRGPDGEGHWVSANGKIGLGHRRLSIIDLSHEADQPMHYMGRYTIVFNGEIYNYIELKEILIQQGYQFKTQSDTEVLMALYHRDKEQCLQLLDGMFSFVLYDAETNEIFCARDRFGEKPFFYSYEKGKTFRFGSEMKCLWAGDIKKEVNERMMFNYLSFGYIENPEDLSETFFKNCARLEHSHFIILNINTFELQIQKYYDIDWKFSDANISLDQAKEKFHELFYTSIKRRLRSDVAVGSSLSGGLDSSLVVCVIDELSKGINRPQNTFSAVFPGFKKDERKYMDYVIARTNANPHFVTPDDNGLIRDIEKLSWHQEEPYGSASIYAQYCVLKLAKENNTTVLLDGQGADEILAGYHHYYTPFFNELKSTSIYDDQLKSYNNLHINNPINGISKKSLGDKLRTISPALIKPAKRLKNFIDQTKSPFFNKEFYAEYKDQIFETPGNNFQSLNEALYTSTYKYGLQQLLRYADRNSMAHSREVRLPFLSHELVEFIFSLPPTYKINQGWTKWIMRETFNILPKEIGWRTDKIGYEPPQKSWMENEEMTLKINSAKQNLSHHKITSTQIINKSFATGESSEKVTSNWKFIMAEQLIK